MDASRDVIGLINGDVAPSLPGLLPKPPHDDWLLTWEDTAVLHFLFPTSWVQLHQPQLQMFRDPNASRVLWLGSIAGEHVAVLESQVEAAELVKSDLRSALSSSPMEAAHVSRSDSVNPNAPLNSPFVDFKLSVGCVSFFVFFFCLFYLSQSGAHSLHFPAEIIASAVIKNPSLYSRWLIEPLSWFETTF